MLLVAWFSRHSTTISLPSRSWSIEFESSESLVRLISVLCFMDRRRPTCKMLQVYIMSLFWAVRTSSCFLL